LITQEASGTRLDREIVDLSSDEEEQYGLGAESIPILFSLNKDDYLSIETSGKELRGSCIQAVIELLHRDTEPEELSSASTDFYPYLTQNKKREAKRLLQPDDRATSRSQSEWIRPETRHATAESRVLLIPCHIVEIDEESQKEMRHWVLVARFKLEGNTCKFLVFDSMGVKWGSRRKKKIRGFFMSINLAIANDTWQVVKTRLQTEYECGIRMAMYMLKFRTWAVRHTQPKEFAEKVEWLINEEKRNKGDIAAEYRGELRAMLQEEQRRIGG
jgi:hypothetical protein